MPPVKSTRQATGSQLGFLGIERWLYPAPIPTLPLPSVAFGMIH